MESSGGNRCHRHQYSDMLNQVYTSHLHAQLNHSGNNHQVPSHNSSKGSSQMFGTNSQSGQTAFGKIDLHFVKVNTF